MKKAVNCDVFVLYSPYLLPLSIEYCYYHEYGWSQILHVPVTNSSWAPLYGEPPSVIWPSYWGFTASWGAYPYSNNSNLQLEQARSLIFYLFPLFQYLMCDVVMRFGFELRRPAIETDFNSVTNHTVDKDKGWVPGIWLEIGELASPDGRGVWISHFQCEIRIHHSYQPSMSVFSFEFIPTR